MNPGMDIVEFGEHDEHDKIWLNLRIYHRMNETFSNSKSFIWRLQSPYNNKSSLLLFLHFCYFAQSQGQSEFQVKNHENIFIFRLFTHIIVVS